jgi:hypothetical protein
MKRASLCVKSGQWRDARDPGKIMPIKRILSPLTCRELWEIASDYLDGALDELTAEGVRQHAEVCGDCRAELSAVAVALAAGGGEAPSSRDPEALARAARHLREALERNEERPPETGRPVQPSDPGLTSRPVAAKSGHSHGKASTD